MTGDGAPRFDGGALAPVQRVPYLPYWPVLGRPCLRLPNGERVAVWLANNVEFYEFRPPENEHRRFWTRTAAPDVLGYALRDYGNRVGFWRLLDILDGFDVPVSASLNLGVLDHCPEIADAILARGWDCFSHGIYNTSFLYGMSPDDERAWVADNMQRYRSYTGKKLRGIFGPAGSLTPNSMEIWASEGIEYVVDWFLDDQPFPLDVASGRLVNVTYSWEVNDARVMGGAAFGGLHEADRLVQLAKDHFDTLYEEGAESARVMCIPLHPYVLGQPWRTGALVEILDYVLSHSGVWMTTAGEIASYYLTTHFDRALEHMRAGEPR